MAELRLLDLFCGAGGAAMGYSRAGFEVVGVDVNPQPHYPFEFHQADALTFPLEGFDVIHASPPCQRRSRATSWRGSRESWPDLLIPTLERLRSEACVPWIVENVPEAGALLPSLLLCGTAFGLPVIRHRRFGLSWDLPDLTPPCAHERVIPFDHGGTKPESVYREALGVGWMTVEESRQAIPPAYTEWLGRRMGAALGGEDG